MPDPIINVSSDTKIVAIVQSDQDAVRISNTIVSTDENVKIVNSIDALGLSIILPTAAPNSSSEIGTPGELRWDNDYMYICLTSSYWKRIPLTEF